MIKIESVQKSFGEEKIFQNVSLVINSKEKIGLVGKNGSGKTTLLKIIVGKIEPDKGSIIVDKNERIGYLPQTVEADFEKTVREFFSNNQKTEDWQIKKSLRKIGFQDINLKMKLKSFSGGETTRIALAKILIKNPTILLLDEPTNHLDIEGLAYLQRFLSYFKGGFLLVSHDRWILDKVTTKIIDIQLTEKGRIAKIYSENFSAYEKVRQKEIEKQETLYELQKKKIKKEEDEIRRVKNRVVALEKATTGSDFAVRKKAAKIAKRSKTKKIKIQKFLESEKRIEKPQKERLLRFLFGTYLAKGQRVIQAKNLSFSFNNSFKKKSLFDSINFELYGKDRIALMGPNGSGKTTFIKILLDKIEPNKGKVKLNPSTKIGYLPQEISFKNQEKTVLEEFEKDIDIEQSEIRRLLGKFLFSGKEQTKKVKDLSIGERRRLYLAKIVASSANFLVLDEPTNHLDIPSIEAIEKALIQFEGAILIISHDIYFLENIGIEKFYYLKQGESKELNNLKDIEKITKLSPN